MRNHCLIQMMMPMLIVNIIAIKATADDNVTARDKLNEVKAKAVSLAGDVELIYVCTDSDVSLSGKAHRWMYFFKSESNQRLYEIWYEDGNIFRHQPLSRWEDFQVRLDFPSLPENWIDSDDAITAAEANGGSDFRAAQGNQYAIAMSLIPAQVAYSVSIWKVAYRSGDNHINIYVNALTGEAYDVSKVTAQLFFADVETAATAEAADAELIEVFAGTMDLEGKCEEWRYIYRSLTQQTIYEFVVRAGWVTQTNESSNPGGNNYFDLEPIPENWINSDTAVTLAEADGGEAFRQNNELIFIGAQLFNSDREPAIWRLDYQTMEGGKEFNISAVSPITAREHLTTVNTAATAIVTDAQLIQVLTYDIGLDGKSGEWRYLYQSLGQQMLLEFVNEGGQVTRSPEITNQNPGVFLGINPLPDDWIDSDLAIMLAEAGGGENYRQTHEGGQIVAELAHPGGADKAEWAMDYQVPGDARIFRIEAVLPALTARERMAEVHMAAQDFCPDAQLVYIQSENINPDGTGNFWKYIYEETSPQTFYEFWAFGDQATEHDLTVTENTLQPGMPPLPLSWYDSDMALTSVEAEGGSDFRTNYSNWKIDISLHMPNQSMGKGSGSENGQAQWNICYSSGQVKQTFSWEAGAFSKYWTAQITGATSTLRSVDAVSSVVCWTSGHQGTVLRTTDGGDTWVDASNGLNPENFYSIAAIDELTAMVVAWEPATAGAVIYRTTDGGSTWTNVYALNGAFLNGVVMFTKTEGIAYGDPYDGEWLLLETSNGGQTWDKMDNSPSQIDDEIGGCAFWLNESVGWFGTNRGRAYRTSNGGENWKFVDIPDIPNVQRIACDSSGHVLVSSGSFSQDTTEFFMRSTDNGETWETLSPPEDHYINWITFHNSRFWLVTGDAVYQSVNQGSTWTLEAMAYGSLRALSFVNDNPVSYGWAVGKAGTVIHYNFDITPVMEQETGIKAQTWALYHNFPNPFNPETTIQYVVPEKSHIRLRIIDLLGREVAVLLDRETVAGSYKTIWNGKDNQGRAVSSGIYLYELRSDAYQEVRRMLLIR